jgi:polyhydroxyalkanoate synthesis repressor PhaR
LAKDDKDPTGPIIIKKYANRRLYNTASGNFVTLADLHELVKQEVAFVVQDAKSGDDLTASILAQIVAEEENKGNNMFSPDYLRQILKLYGDGTPPELAAYLEQSISYFNENQDQMTKQFSDMLDGSNSMEKWAEIGQQNVAIFQKSMEAFSQDTQNEDIPPKPESGEPDTGNDETEIEKLRKEMAEMQARLDGLSAKK